jgi:hypothetical protein
MEAKNILVDLAGQTHVFEVPQHYPFRIKNTLNLYFKYLIDCSPAPQDKKKRTQGQS